MKSENPENKFTYYMDDKGIIKGIQYENGYKLTLSEILDLLNKQSQTISQIRNTLEYYGRIRRGYYEENHIYSLHGNWENLTIKDIREDNTYITPVTVRDKLNRLYNENQELYMFRLLYNALLFNNWSYYDPEIRTYKSRRHSDGRLCFEGEYFIVVAILPNGEQISNHYHIRYYKLFDIPEYDQCPDEFDGHTSSDVISRLRGLL